MWPMSHKKEHGEGLQMRGFQALKGGYRQQDGVRDNISLQ